MELKLFVATKAFIVHTGRVLIVQESAQYREGTNAGKYDVVGGRIKPGERFDAGLLREVKEETGLVVKIGRPFVINEWRPIVNGEQWQIVGIFFECFSDSDAVILSKDHKSFLWIDPEKYREYALIENLDSIFASYLTFKK